MNSMNLVYLGFIVTGFMNWMEKNLSPRMGGNSVTNKLNKESGILSDSLFFFIFLISLIVT